MRQCGGLNPGQKIQSVEKHVRLRNNLLNLLVVVIGIALSAVVLELTTRYVFDNGMNFDLEMWKYANEHKSQKR